MPIVYVVVAFLFYRIATAASFDAALSILACLISTAISTFLILIYSNYVSVSLGKLAFERTMKGSTIQKWEVLLMPTLVLLACNFGQMYLVALGFSEKFYEMITDYGYRRDFVEQPVLWFFVLSIMPPMCYIFVLISHLQIAPITPSEADKLKSEHKRCPP